GSEWSLHATGTIRRDTAAASQRSVEDVRARCVESVDVAEYYQALRTQGLEYGPSFQGLQQIWRCDGEAIGRLQLPADMAQDTGPYHGLPAFLDAGFQLLAAAIPGAQPHVANGHVYLPVRLAGVRSYARPSPNAELWGHMVARSDPESTPDAFEGDLFLTD